MDTARDSSGEWAGAPRRLAGQQDGATAVEYAVCLALVLLGSIAGASALGIKVSDVLQFLGTSF